MKTRNFECEGKICNPSFLAIKEVLPEHAYINYCVTEWNGKDWIVPKGWHVVDGKVICPRCFDKP